MDDNLNYGSGTIYEGNLKEIAIEANATYKKANHEYCESEQTWLRLMAIIIYIHLSQKNAVSHPSRFKSRRRHPRLPITMGYRIVLKSANQRR